MQKFKKRGSQLQAASGGGGGGRGALEENVKELVW